MQAEIIAIGTELTSGAKLDTNSQWLSLRLGEIGIHTRAHTTIADTLDEMVQVLATAVERSDLVLITGGLGPTRDDITRFMIAEVMGVDLVLDDASLAHIENMFSRRGREMPAANRVQAEFPIGSTPISNPRGTAPGIRAEVLRRGGLGRALVVALPGVPSEMKRMYEQEVLPALPRSGRVIQRAGINCFGLGESAAEELLGDLTARGRNPEVGITVHEATITLRVVATGSSPEECQVQIQQTRRVIEERLGSAVFGFEDEELEDVVVPMLRQVGASLASAEIGTGGLLAHRLTDVPGHESSYLGSFVAPATDSLLRLLDVDRRGLSEEELATICAQQARRRCGADFGLAITACPEWDAEDHSRPAPELWIALAGEDVVETHCHKLVGDPAIAKSRAVKQALDLVRHRLLAENASL